ncbi:MAG: hypothetical protein ABJQ29_04380 [Luteolibacter sp.]
MKDKKISSAFSTTDYVRPNQDWVCGHLCKGEACRIGPSPKGKCRATYECVPLLDLKPGETKGQYKCTRPASAGGKCDRGPMPDGTCCNAIPKCQPRRTLRNIRKRFVVFTVIASFIVLFIGLDRTTRDKFVNPAPISSPHASKHFSDLTKQITGDDSNCAGCHESARRNAGTWPAKIGEALSGGLAPFELFNRGPAEPSGMDNNCLACHAGKSFHQPNMPDEYACHTCHKEHAGSGFIAEVTNDYCLTCHSSEKLMQEAAKIAAHLDPHTFPSSPDSKGLNSSLGRPEDGYTQVIRDFHDGHPEFRVIREEIRDKNTLKFNHEVHMKTGGVQKLDGSALSCMDCHNSDAKGEYQLPITYDQHCSDCHALQFDPDTIGDATKPGLVLPHGDPFYVRSFLRSLNIQYETYAKTEEGITGRDELKAYVEEKRASIEEFYETGEELERAVFFSGKDKRLPNGEVAQFESCATCHEVSPPAKDNGTPVIAKVYAPNRWMEVGKFNHELHKNVLPEDKKHLNADRGEDAQCLACHEVLSSTETSDVNLPGIASCTTCHSPDGGIDHRCVRCHTYHNSPSGSLFGGIPHSAPDGKKQSSGE